jgi:hypothetical protein
LVPVADVSTDLQAETGALAERHGYGRGADLTGYFARLTSTARPARLGVENPAAFGVTPQISYGSLDEVVVSWLIEQRKAAACSPRCHRSRCCRGATGRCARRCSPRPC